MTPELNSIQDDEETRHTHINEKGTDTDNDARSSYRQQAWNNCTRNRVSVSTNHGHYGMVKG
jgi:hypothetical protein